MQFSRLIVTEKTANSQLKQERVKDNFLSWSWSPSGQKDFQNWKKTMKNYQQFIYALVQEKQQMDFVYK